MFRKKVSFQLICSILTIPMSVACVILILDGLFKVDVSAFYNVIEKIFPPDGLIGKLMSDTTVMIIMAIIHFVIYLISGGFHYGWICFRKLVSFSFALPIPIVNVLLGILVAIYGLLFVAALAPIFIIVSAIMDYNGISVELEVDDSADDDPYYKYLQY